MPPVKSAGFPGETGDGIEKSQANDAIRGEGADEVDDYRVSAVIPAFERHAAVGAAVRSVLAQTRVPDEIVVVDDHSPEPITRETIAVDDPRLRIVRLPENRGAAGARQAGVEAAQSDFVAFLDSDDVWLPRKLETQLRLVDRARPLRAVSCGWIADRGAGRRPRGLVPKASSDVRDFASGCWFCPGSTVLVAREAFALVGSFDPSLRRLEDLDWFLRLALAGGEIAVVGEIGARIAIGRRASRPAVARAAEILRERYMGAEPAVRRRLSAYLALEEAAVARNEHRYGAMIVHSFRSLAVFPRRTLHLERWWVETPIPAGGIDAS